MRPVIFAALLAACASAPPPTPSAAPSSAEFGLSKASAVEVCEPAGERAYLRRLRCADGSAPQFERSGSVGMRNPITSKADEAAAMSQIMDKDGLPPGTTDFHTIDLYEVRCGDKTTEVFLDMYHCQQPPPAQAPLGFTIE